MADKSQRVQKFKTNVTALNKQFLQWFTEQVATKPDKLASSGLSDYLRHAAKLNLEFQDVLNEGEDGEADRRRRSRLLTLTPLSHTKTLHLIRHGEGFHNIGRPNPDAHLTPRGWQQAHALGEHMAKFQITRDVELVIVSPLRRTLETAAGVFGIGTSSNNNSAGGVLMKGQEEKIEEVVAHGEILAPRSLRFVAHELCRERLGPGACDGRRSRSQAAEAFPAVDFSLIQDDEDKLWRANVAESEASVVERGRQFLQYVASLPDVKNIAIVTHSAFLWFALSVFGTEFVRPVRERLQRWYENCEMRTVILNDGGGLSFVVDSTHFPGGHAALEPQFSIMEEEGTAPMIALNNELPANK
jgi:broad specificity phosphatase PhoE